MPRTGGVAGFLLGWFGTTRDEPMANFAYIVGMLQVLVGFVIVIAAPSSIQEIGGLLMIGFGLTCICIGGVIAAVIEISPKQGG